LAGVCERGEPHRQQSRFATGGTPDIFWGRRSLAVYYSANFHRRGRLAQGMSIFGEMFHVERRRMLERRTEELIDIEHTNI
jgi:hypothetical protein